MALYTAEVIRKEAEEIYFRLKKIYLDGKQYVKPTEAKTLIYAINQMLTAVKYRVDEELLEKLKKLHAEQEGGGEIESITKDIPEFSAEEMEDMDKED